MIRGTCRFPECGKRHFGKGLCNGHWRQQWLGNELRPLNMVRSPIESADPAVWLVPLTNGFFALIDAADAAAVGKHNWQIKLHPGTNRKYARTHVTVSPGRTREKTLHRFLWEKWGMPSTPEIDHENLDGLDNRRSNLRAASRSENVSNVPVRRTNRLGSKGIRQRESGKYEVRITKDHVIFHAGTFDTLLAAEEAHRAASLRLHGEFARRDAGLVTPR